jgi:hypothetical protein
MHLNNQGWFDWLSARLVTLEEVSLSVESDDLVVRQFAQTNNMILLTANRQIKGRNSLAQVLREKNTEASLAIVWRSARCARIPKFITCLELRDLRENKIPIAWISTALNPQLSEG